jgi:hypothetical protein
MGILPIAARIWCLAGIEPSTHGRPAAAWPKDIHLHGFWPLTREVEWIEIRSGPMAAALPARCRRVTPGNKAKGTLTRVNRADTVCGCARRSRRPSPRHHREALHNQRRQSSEKCAPSMTRETASTTGGLLCSHSSHPDSRLAAATGKAICRLAYHRLDPAVLLPPHPGSSLAMILWAARRAVARFTDLHCCTSARSRRW